jgi:hypothetical protein
MLRPVITEGYRRRLLTGRQAHNAPGRQCWSRVAVRQNSRLPNPRVASIRLEIPDSHCLWLAALPTGSTSPSRRSVILLLLSQLLLGNSIGCPAYKRQAALILRWLLPAAYLMHNCTQCPSIHRALMTLKKHSLRQHLCLTVLTLSLRP